MSYTRRAFLKTSGATTLSLCLNLLQFKVSPVYGAQVSYPYRGWEDIYRKKWVWDKIVKGSHYANCGPQAGCNFNIYIKDGIVLREEQVASYLQTNSEVPDFNPRGCQKGVCFSQRMYDPARIKYPLKRIGERGEGSWKRVGWDEALTEIADTLIDVISQEGVDTIIFDSGANISFGIQGLGFFRTKALLDATCLTLNTEIGDGFPGVAMTLGKMLMHCSGDDMFYSDVILIWGGNPLCTQIPNSHFFLETRYHGATLVTITPDYSPSAIHSDLWIPIKPGTDAALGLSVAQVMIMEGLYNESFLKEQTDLPLLVREDTRRFLREKDLKEGGEEDLFYAFDLGSRSIKEMPKKSLSLDGIDPALEGEYEVETLSGKVKVQPVFEFLRHRLEDYSPEKASRITGIHPDTIRVLARTIAQAKAVTIISQQNSGKYYHGSLIERAQILVLALGGHFGRKGSGLNSFYIVIPDGTEVASVAPPRPSLVEAVRELERNVAPIYEGLKEKGYTDELVIYELEREAVARKAFVSGTIFFYLHGGVKELSEGKTRSWDPYLRRETGEYVKEALEKGWQFVGPAPGKTPQILISGASNVLRRVRGYPKLIEKLLPKLRLIVMTDWRMNNSGLYSDFILPCAGWYEKDDLRISAGVIPEVHVITKAAEPLGEAKSEWEIYCLLAKKIQERAKQKAILSFTDKGGKERRLDRLYDDLTFERTYSEKNIERLISDVLKVSKNFEGVTWAELKGRGHARATSMGSSSMALGNATDIKPNETITPHTWHVVNKIPWPTLTRRIQFYLDHELFLELGEELPVHKESIKAGGDYPLQMTSGHTRWSIHTSWRDDAYMLRLQRGVPVMYMSGVDTKARGIKDGEEVEVRNALGSFRIQAKVSPGVRPGQVIVYHAWEPYQFKGGKSDQCLTPGPINPVELGGGYFHLRPTMFSCEPLGKDRDTRVEVVKIT